MLIASEDATVRIHALDELCYDIMLSNTYATSANDAKETKVWEETCIQDSIFEANDGSLRVD